MDIAEKVISKADDIIKEAPEETENPVRVKDKSVVQSERKKIPLPVNQQRKVKVDARNETEQLQPQNTKAVKKSVIEQIKSEQKLVPAEAKRLQTERPPQPQPSMLARKYPCLKEIDSKLKDQNKAIFEREKKRDKELLINNYLQNIPSCAILSSNISNCIGGKNGYTC